MKLIADQLAEVVTAAVHAAQAAEQLPALTLPDIVVERPKRKEQGDWATALPLQLVRPVNEARARQSETKLTPLQIAQIIAAHIQQKAHPALANGRRGRRTEPASCAASAFLPVLASRATRSPAPSQAAVPSTMAPCRPRLVRR